MSNNGRVKKLEQHVGERAEWGLSPETMRCVEVALGIAYGTIDMHDVPSPSELAELEARGREQDAELWAQLDKIYGEVQDE